MSDTEILKLFKDFLIRENVILEYLYFASNKELTKNFRSKDKVPVISHFLTKETTGNELISGAFNWRSTKKVHYPNYLKKINKVLGTDYDNLNPTICFVFWSNISNKWKNLLDNKIISN